MSITRGALLWCGRPVVTESVYMVYLKAVYSPRGLFTVVRVQGENSQTMYVLHEAQPWEGMVFEDPVRWDQTKVIMAGRKVSHYACAQT